MKAGLIYEIETVKPFKSPTYEADIYRETLEQIELADRLGFDSVWTVEHHFLHEFSYCSAPEVFLGCVAGRTKRIRIGHGVVVLPFNHPVRVAERIGVLDIVSNGRVEFGTGRATTMDEILGFGMTPDQTRPRWAEAVEMIPRMWREDPFTYKGKYWSVEHPVSVIPKPVQKPHPPMWVACTNPTTFELAAQRGLGALCFTLGVELRDVAPRIKLYRDTIKRAKPVGQSINNQVSLNIMGLIDDNPKKAEDLAHDAVLWYVRKGFTLVSSVAEAKIEGRVVQISAHRVEIRPEANHRRLLRLPQRRRSDRGRQARPRRCGWPGAIARSAPTRCCSSCNSARFRMNRSCARSKSSERKCCPKFSHGRRPAASRFASRGAP